MKARRAVVPGGEAKARRATAAAREVKARREVAVRGVVVPGGEVKVRRAADAGREVKARREVAAWRAVAAPDEVGECAGVAVGRREVVGLVAVAGHASEGEASRAARRVRRLLATGAVTVLAGVYPAAAAAAEPEARVLGGSETSAAEAPWIVALTDESDRQFCGGALLSPIKVVTAAHCTIDLSTGKPRPLGGLRAVVGRSDLRTQEGVVSAVDAAWVHPRYQGFASGHDVAVLTLRTPVDYRVLPLVGQGETAPYQTGTVGRVYGWGRTSESGAQSSVLRSVEVPVTPDAECGRAYAGFDRSSMFCAGTPEGGRDACGGDSGGPYVVNGRLVGVVSYGVGCGRPEQPGVYTRLATYAGEIAGA
ncbi:S1 family serine peptidase [Saccharopolyspora erythraea]|uniref:S1 family serine peptidase n=1 Tax=Saccharopolyspora erythraea TaxID=1836 RepID=UPI002010FBB0|nr:serine protease [Saccharopolyspora erythraea]